MSTENSGQKRKLSSGRPIKYKEVETEILGWTTQKRNLAAPVSARMLTAKIMKDYPALFERYNRCLCWVYSMLGRNYLSIRRKTQDQKVLPEEEMGIIHLNFVHHVCSLMDIHTIDPSHVKNMDETGCYFDVGISKTIDFTGSKTVRILNTESEGYIGH